VVQALRFVRMNQPYPTLGEIRNENLLSCAFEVPKQDIHTCLTTKCLDYLFFIT